MSKKLTKAQKLGLPVTQPEITYEATQEALEPYKVESGPTLDLEVVLHDPENVIDELYVPIKKEMKKVRTHKTGVGQEILALIAEGELSNREIVERVLAENPLRKTTYACVAWYKSQVAAGKIDLPVVVPVEEEPTEEATEV